MTKVTQQIFDTVKTLLNSGVSVSNICDMLKISNGVVYTIKLCDDLQGYKQYIKDVNKRSYEKKKKETKKEEPAPEPVQQVIEHRQTVTVQATHYMMEEMKKTNELLTVISRKLAYIVDDLYGSKKTEESGG